MSITIQLEDFRSWSEVFAEIERQCNMRLFEIIKPNHLPFTTEKRKRDRSFRCMRDVASVKEKIDGTSQQKNSRVYGLEAHHVLLSMK